MSINRLSEEAKLAIKTLEDDRDEAMAAGNTDDWWVRKLSPDYSLPFPVNFNVCPS